MAELDRLSDKVYTPRPIKEKAAVIYRKALDKSLVRGRSIAAIMAAAVYAACRGSGTPKALHEIAEANLVDRKDSPVATDFCYVNLICTCPSLTPSCTFRKSLKEQEY